MAIPDENGQLGGDLFPALDELTEEEIEQYEGSPAVVGGRTLNEAERSGGNLSDFKMALKTIVPDWSDNDIDELETIKKAIMVSNISYDVVLAQMQLTINAIIVKHARDKKPINPMVVYNICQGIFFPAIQGRRTIDILELYGSAGNSSSEETKSSAERLGY